MSTASLVRRVARLEARRMIGTADVVPCPRCGGSGEVAWPIEDRIMADVRARLGDEPPSIPADRRGCRLCSARGEVPVEVAADFMAQVEWAASWITDRLTEVASRLGDGPIGSRHEEISGTGPDG